MLHYTVVNVCLNPGATKKSQSWQSALIRHPTRVYERTEGNRTIRNKKKTPEKRNRGKHLRAGEGGDADCRGRVDYDRGGGGSSAQPSRAGRGGRVGGGGAGAHLRLLPQGDPRRAGEDARRGRAPRDGALRGRGRARRPLPLPLLLVQAPLRRRGRGTYGRSRCMYVYGPCDCRQLAAASRSSSDVHGVTLTLTPTPSSIEA
jgi:hypothetical protein